MSKNALIDELEPHFADREQATKALETVTGGILSMVARGEMVVLKGFGTFKQKRRMERMGRNPKTGEPVPIPAQTKLVFDSKVTFS